MLTPTLQVPVLSLGQVDLLTAFFTPKPDRVHLCPYLVRNVMGVDSQKLPRDTYSSPRSDQIMLKTGASPAVPAAQRAPGLLLG